MLAEGKVCLPGSVHIQAHRLSDSLGKLLGVHFLLMTVERVVEVREKKWLVLAKSKHRLSLLFRAVVFAIGNGASARAASANNVNQNVTAGQTRILRTAAVLHCAGDLRPSVLRVTSIKETLVSFGLHCWLIDFPGNENNAKNHCCSHGSAAVRNAQVRLKKKKLRKFYDRILER